MNQDRQDRGDHNKNWVLAAVACLLLLVAGYRFWSMLADARSRTEINAHSTLIEQKIVSNVGPHHPDPLAELDLTDEQRRKIDDILKASLPPPPSPDKAGGSGPHLVRIRFPAEKIRAVLTPEQRQKFDLRGHKGTG
jgi:Spy/CpxP family protein refolding chaperone